MSTQNVQEASNAKKQRGVVVLFVVLVVLAFVAVICRVYLRGDYVISSEIACDPTEEKCFVRECEEDCDSSDQDEYYKLRTVAAAFVSTCNPSVEDCPNPLCSNIPTCVETLCTEADVPEGEWCNDPIAYRDTMQHEEASELTPEEANETDE